MERNGCHMATVFLHVVFKDSYDVFEKEKKKRAPFGPNKFGGQKSDELPSLQHQSPSPMKAGPIKGDIPTDMTP